MLALTVLLSITGVKIAAVIIPVAVEYEKLGHRRFWWATCWVGGFRIAIYGAFNTVVKLVLLSGVIQPAGGYDTRALTGHAFIWDLSFLLWGVALGAFLHTRCRTRSQKAPVLAAKNPTLY